MSHTKIGTQTIGCSVKRPRYNAEGNYCELSRIQVEPMQAQINATQATRQMKAFAAVICRNK